MDRHEGFVVGSFTGFLVVATVMLWLSTHKLWKAGERQIAVAKRAADVAEQSLVSTQRAFVFVRGFNGIALTDNQIVCLWKIWPIWENSGTTPSRHLFNHVSWRKFVGEMPADFNFPDVQQPRTIQEQTRLFLGPKATINGETVAIPTADLLESAAGTARVYVWGWAEYDDVFSDTNAHHCRPVERAA